MISVAIGSITLFLTVKYDRSCDWTLRFLFLWMYALNEGLKTLTTYYGDPIFAVLSTFIRILKDIETCAEVACWTLDRVRFPAYPHRVWALWWQGGKRRLRTSRCPCRGRLDTLKTPSCPWHGCSAAGQNLETGHLSEISLNVTLNHNKQQQQQQHRNMWIHNNTS